MKPRSRDSRGADIIRIKRENREEVGKKIGCVAAVLDFGQITEEIEIEGIEIDLWD